MNKILIAAVAILLSATSMTLAQSQQNCGPAGPVRGDCYGQPYSGSAEARCVCGHYRGGYYWHRW
jgi:hypothetical protein